MKNHLTRTSSAALISLISDLPYAVFCPLLHLTNEPEFRTLQPLLASPHPNQPDVVGSLIAPFTFLLVIAAFVSNLLQIVRAVQSGGGVTTHSGSLVLALIPLAVILAVIGGIIVKQYPCWMGVPNCD